MRLYAEVGRLAGPLLPSRLPKPDDLAIHWLERTPEEFIAHLLLNGNADNRYLIYGYATRGEDLHMLDAMVFAIRRLICPLDDQIFPGYRAGRPPATHRDVLTGQPAYYGQMAMPLDDLIRSREESDRRRAALNLNMAFAGDDYPHASMQSSSSARSPVIIRRILDPLESDDPRWAAEGVEIAQWFLDKVQVPKGKPGDPGVTEQIQKAIKAAQVKHGPF